MSPATADQVKQASDKRLERQLRAEAKSLGKAEEMKGDGDTSSELVVKQPGRNNLTAGKQSDKSKKTSTSAKMKPTKVAKDAKRIYKTKSMKAMNTMKATKAMKATKVTAMKVARKPSAKSRPYKGTARVSKGSSTSSSSTTMMKRPASSASTTARAKARACAVPRVGSRVRPDLEQMRRDMFLAIDGLITDYVDLTVWNQRFNMGPGVSWAEQLARLRLQKFKFCVFAPLWWLVVVTSAALVLVRLLLLLLVLLFRLWLVSIFCGPITRRMAENLGYNE